MVSVRFFHVSLLMKIYSCFVLYICSRSDCFSDLPFLIFLDCSLSYYCLITYILQIETVENPRGLCEVSQGSGEMVMVCLGTQKGQIRIENSGTAKRTRFVNAHDSRLVCLSLSADGRFCATASGKGTLVRVFNTLDGSLLQEVGGRTIRSCFYYVDA